MKNIYLSFLMALLCVPLWSQTKIIPFQELPTAGGQPTGSGMFFGASMNSNSITVTFEGPADRWIAIGFGQSMFPTDAFIYSNGKSGATHPVGWNDYYVSSGSSLGVNNDPQQHWTVVSTATLGNGQRTVTATRALSTGDANDVAVSFSASLLDVVWARGATPDYTIAYHGNTNRAYLIALTWLSQPTASFVSSTSVCVGAPMTYTNFSTGGQTSYNWTFQGGSPATSTLTNPVVTYSVAGTYSVALTASNAVGSSTYTQVNYITVTPTVAPSISIAQVSGNNPMCAGAPVTFSATVVNGGSNPSYQWRFSGTNVGPNNPVFNTSLITASTNITCVLSSNATCANPATFTSSPISMTVNSTAPATATASVLSGGNPICTGAAVVFTVTTGNPGTNPTYNWSLNGTPVGVNSSTFSSSGLANNDYVSCTIISNAPCTSNTLGVGPGVTMSVSSVLQPSVSIAAAANPVCAGTTATFIAQTLNGGSTPTLQWQINGVNAGTNSTVLTTSTIVNGQTVSFQLISSLACASPASALSNVINFTVNPIPPTPSVTVSGPLAFCAGGSATLTSSAASSNSWTTGETTPVIVVNNPGAYSVFQIVNGCSSNPAASVTASVVPGPTAAVQPVPTLCADAPPVQLVGTPAGGSFSGNGVAGTVFNPALATIGDNNIVIYQYTAPGNCVDSQAVRITVSECLGLSDQKKENVSFSLYPNPGSGLFSLHSRNGAILSVRVTDLFGKTLRQYDHVDHEELRLDLSDLPDGTYLVEALTETSRQKLRLSKQSK